MLQSVGLLEQLLKSKASEEAPEVVKLTNSSIFKILKSAVAKISEHSELLQGLMLKTEQIDLKLHDKTNVKDMEELIKIVGNEQRDIFDCKLTSRNSARESGCGLDRVMIEEVRTITQALIERRIQMLEFTKFQEKILMDRQIDMNSRRSDNSTDILKIRAELNCLSERITELNEKKIDERDFENRLRQERTHFSQQIEKSAKKSRARQEKTEEKEKFLKVEHDLESIRHSIKKTARPISDFSMASQFEELRQTIESKIDRKEFNELKNKIVKDLTNKISLEDVEKIVKNFQNEVFDKMNQDRKNLEASFPKTIRQEFARLQQGQPTTNAKINDIKHSLQRVQKKIANKLQHERNEESAAIQVLQKNHQDIREDIRRVQNQTCRQMKSMFELLQASIQEQENKVTRWSLKKRPETIDKARWGCSLQNELKGGFICWDSEEYNSNLQNFLYQKKKSQILIVASGIYELKLAVFNSKKPIISLLVNGQPIQARQECRNQATGVILYAFVQLTPRSKISVKTENEVRVAATLQLTKYL